jgi:hypothetical protein
MGFRHNILVALLGTS